MQKPGGMQKPGMMMEMLGHMEDGLCMDPFMIIKMCVMGTPLGKKMCEARQKCKKPMKPMKPNQKCAQSQNLMEECLKLKESRKKETRQKFRKEARQKTSQVSNC